MKRVIVLLGSGLVMLAGCSDSNIADVGVAKAANGGQTIHMSLADDPAQAGIDWYLDQFWNPITEEVMDAFLTVGQTQPRREPRIAPTCTSNRPTDRLIQLNLQSSRTLSQRR